MLLQQSPDNSKLIRSAAISFGAVALFALVNYLFPDMDLSEMQTALMTAVLAWVINTLKETNG